MGVGVLAVGIFVPATVIAVVAACWLALDAVRAGSSWTAISCFASLVMIASPLVLAAFATRPQPDDDNPIFLIQYGVFPSALLATIALAIALLLRRRYVLFVVPALLLISLGYLGRADVVDPMTGYVDGLLQWSATLAILGLATYPLIWVFAIRELSEYATLRLAKPLQG